MIHLCTVFDKNYAAKGLALYRSLERTTKDFSLHILALDDNTGDVLTKLNLKHATISYLSDLVKSGDAGWMATVKNRPWKYFCWSIGSIWTRIVFETFGREDDEMYSDHYFAYIDADCYFFAGAEIAIYELEDHNKKVGIVPHRFPLHDHDRLIPNGKYNVSLAVFRDSEGYDVLDWWTRQCIRKCDETTVGDQKYLNEFHEILDPDPVLDFSNPGIGLAPWNVNQYLIHKMGDVLVCRDFRSDFAVVFFHFHETMKKQDGEFFYTGYPLRQEDIELIYLPYVEAHKSAERELANAGL